MMALDEDVRKARRYIDCIDENHGEALICSYGTGCQKSYENANYPSFSVVPNLKPIHTVLGLFLSSWHAYCDHRLIIPFHLLFSHKHPDQPALILA